jgi:mono/diheme cytochrome c family protein
MLKSSLLVSTALFIALTPMPSLGGSPQEKPAAKATTSEAHTKAKKVYEQDCALCHGDNGSGQTDIGKSMNLASDWTKQATLAGKADEALFEIIRKGKAPNMPPEAEGRADDATVKHMIAYIRSLSKGEAAAPAAPAASAAPATPEANAPETK